MHSRSDLLEDERPAHAQRNFAELVGGVGSGAALILGLIYGVGALVKTAELRNSGVNVGVAFPLIPMQQHLSRGIEIFLAPETLGLVALIFVIGAVIHRFRFPLPRWSKGIGVRFDEGLLITVPNKKRSRREDEKASGEAEVSPGAKTVSGEAEVSGSEKAASSKGTGTQVKEIAWSLRFQLGVLALFFFLTTTVSTLLTIVASLALTASWLLLSHSGRAVGDRKGWFWSTPALVVAAALTVGSVSVVKAFAASTDLSVAKLNLADASTISGQVITVTDQAWYLAVRAGQIKVVDANRVLSGTVSKAKPVKNAALQKTGFKLMFPLAYNESYKWVKKHERSLKRIVDDVRRWTKRYAKIVTLAVLAIVAMFSVARRWLRRDPHKSSA